MKGIIVVDIPECCDMCRFSSQAYGTELFDEGECYCAISMESVDNIAEGNKPSWCPIRPIPERKDFDGYVENPMIGTSAFAFRMGWNACLDRIEGRKENEADA